MAAVIGQTAPVNGASPPAAADDDAFAALVLEAQASLAQALGVLPVFMGKLDGAIDHARQPVDPVALERSMEQAVQRLERAAARGANLHSVQMVKAHNLRTLLTYGGAFVVAVLAAAGGGFAYGQASANAAVHETEQQLAQAFQGGTSAAANWANLTRWNDINSSLAACTGYALKVVEGRKACFAPLWIEPPNLAVPARLR